MQDLLKYFNFYNVYDLRPLIVNRITIVIFYSHLMCYILKLQTVVFTHINMLTIMIKCYAKPQYLKYHYIMLFFIFVQHILHYSLFILHTYIFVKQYYEASPLISRVLKSTQ